MGLGILCVAAVLWQIAWIFLVYEEPSQHPRISSEERQFILKSLDQEKGLSDEVKIENGEMKKLIQSQKVAEDTSFRLLKIIATPSVWAVWMGYVCFYWGYYAFLTNMPKYFHEVLYFDIESNGFLSAIPIMALGTMSLLVGPFGKVMVSSGWMSIVGLRKSATVLGMIIPGLILFLVWFVDCTKPLFAIIILTSAIGLMGANSAGIEPNYLDIAGRFAAIVFAIGETAAGVAGFVAVVMIGNITIDQSKESWAIAITITGSVMSLGGLIFITFGKASLASWAQ